MTEHLPSKDQFSAVKEFDEWNAVTGALPDHTSWNYECRSILEDADKEIQRLREDLQRSESARVALLAENEHYKQQLRAAQARIDALMLEYCPDEMTPEQRENWAANQRAAQPPGAGQ